MSMRPPLRVALLIAVATTMSLSLTSSPADAGGRKGSAHSKSGGGGGHYRSGGGGGGYLRSGPRRRFDRHGHHARHRSHHSFRHRRHRYGYRRHSYRSYPYYSSYGRYGYNRYSSVYPTPTYYYTPRYYGYYPSSYYQDKARRLQRELDRERNRRYDAYYWRSWPPYYRPQGPSAEGSCLYGADEALIYQPKGKSCDQSLAAR